MSHAPREQPGTLVHARPEAPGTEVCAPLEPSGTAVFVRPEAPGTEVCAPLEPSGTAVFVRPEAPGTEVYAPTEPSGTAVFVRPEVPGTEAYVPREPSGTELIAPPAPFASEPATAVVSLEHMPFASSPVPFASEQPTQVVSLQQLDDEQATRIISLQQLFADKTTPIPRDEILALAKAARAAAREAGRAATLERPPRSAPSPEQRRERASRPITLETAARGLPPPAWSTTSTKPEPDAASNAADIDTKSLDTDPPLEFSLAKAPELAESVLIEHFEGAVEALQQTLSGDEGQDLPALAKGPQARWRSNLDVLKLNAELASRLVLLPVLFDAHQTEERRLAAALALLSMKGGPGLLDAIEDFDDVCHRVVTTALAHLDDVVQVESLVGVGSTLAGKERRLDWLGVFVRRAADPGPELLRELLAAREPGALAMGLRLLPFHANARSFAEGVDRHLLSTTPEIRSAAIVAGLALGRPSAWMQCRQAARAPDYPEPCLLLATLGDVRDHARLVSWARRAAAPDYVGWALGVSGRLAGIRASLELAQAGDEPACELALAGFNVATGADADTSEVANSWWEEHGGRFEDGPRYLRGEPLTLASLGAQLQRGSLRWREALALELLVRSGGEVRLPTSFMPSRGAALAASLEELDLDFEADYRAHRAKQATR